MTQSRFNTICERIDGLLRQSPAVASEIHRARMRSIPENWSEAIVIRLVSAQFDSAPLGADMYTDTLIAIECYARNTKLSPDAIADGLMKMTHARLMDDPTLNGATSALMLTSINWDFDTDSEKTACATLTYALKHNTNSTTLE